VQPFDILQSQFCNDVSVMRMKSRSVLQAMRKICWPGTSQICRGTYTENIISQEHYLTKHKLKLGRDQSIKWQGLCRASVISTLKSTLTLIKMRHVSKQDLTAFGDS